MQQPTIEERLSALEDEVAELKQARHNQDTINGALLARIDSFIGDIHRLEREQRHGFDSQAAQIADLKADVTTLQGDVAGLKEDVSGLAQGMRTLTDIARDHRQAIESLAGQMSEFAAGQQQILSLLTGGKPPRND